jgi:hypothetical protein
MAILRTVVIIAEGGSIYMSDTVSHEGGLWLVPAWSDPQADGLIYPNRLIRIDRLRLQKLAAGNHYGADYVLNDPMPKWLFDHAIPPELEGRFDVIERPNLGFEPPTAH